MKKYIYAFSLLFLAGIFYTCDNNTEKNDPPVFRLSVSPEELVFSSETDKKQLAVTCNGVWHVVSDQEWCRYIYKSEMKEETAVDVEVDRNTGETARIAILTFSYADSSSTCKIIQEGCVKAVNLPDPAFRNYCLSNYDANKDGILSEKEAADIKVLQVASKQISSLEGIEKFESLAELSCENNSIKRLNLSSLKHLTGLNCSQNQLAELDIRSNSVLKKLDCTGNPLLTGIKVGDKFRSTVDFKKSETTFYILPDLVIPKGYVLAWQEEFNCVGTTGKHTDPDKEKWSYETGGGGWGNNELQNYIPGIYGTDTCAAVSDGILRIIARKRKNEVISARMNTVQSWTYGYFEARLKLPGGRGTWPAFWMMPKDAPAWPADGEIDIMEEVGFRPGYVSSAIHCKTYNHVLGTQKTAEKFVPDAESNFHIYALEWTKEYIKGFVDGECYFTFLNDRQNNHDTWPFSVPFYLKLNLAWGGNWAGMQGVDESILPATYEIDYVRVFQRK